MQPTPVPTIDLTSLTWIAIGLVVAFALFKVFAPKKKLTGGGTTTGTTTGTAPVAAGTLGTFLGMKLDIDLLQEGGITHFDLGDRKIGCDPNAYHLGLQPSAYDPVEVCMKFIHRESGRSMPVYIDNTALECGECWVDLDTGFYFYPLSHRPGEGKPTNCNPAVQALYDKQYAEFQAAQAAVFARRDAGIFSKVPSTTPNPVGTIASTAVAGDCCGQINVYTVNVPEGAEHVDAEFFFRSKRDHSIKSHWKETLPVVRTGCPK